MKRIIIGLFLLAAIALPAEVKPLQFNLSYWLVKPASNQALLTTSSPTFAGLTLSGGTASTLAYLNASKAFTSLANGSGYLLNDGSGGLSWAAVSLSGYLKADRSVALTGVTGPAAIIIDADEKFATVVNAAGYLTNDGSGAMSYTATVPATSGGTGQTSYAVGDLLYAPTTTTVGKLADVAVGQVLTSGGVGVAPAYSANPVLTSVLGASGSGTDQAGTAINIKGGQSTGTGIPGSVILNVGTTSTTGSSANAYQTTPAMTIALDGITTHQAYLNDATGNEAAFTLNYQTNKSSSGNDAGLKIVQTDTASPGTSYLTEWYTGATQVGYLTNAGAFQCDTSVTTGTVNAGAAIIPQVSSNGQLLLNYVTSNHSTANAACMLNYSKTFTGANVSQGGFTIYDNITQTGTSGMSDLIIYRIENTIGSGNQRLVSAQVGGVEKWGVDNRGGMVTGMTADAILQVGMVAMVDAGTDERFDVNGAGGTLPIGIVTGSGATAQGTAYGLAVQGTCYVAPAEDVVAVTRGHVCFVDGSDAGYVDDNAALQAAGLNVGIYLTSEAAIAFDGEVDVDPTANTIVLDSTPTWVVGDPVVFWDSGDTAPTGMTTGAVYWIKTIATATVTLSATRGGDTLDITGDGSGTTMYLMRLPKCIIHWN